MFEITDYMIILKLLQNRKKIRAHQNFVWMVAIVLWQRMALQHVNAHQVLQEIDAKTVSLQWTVWICFGIYKLIRSIYLASKPCNFHPLQGICVPATCNFNGNCFVVPYNETDAEAVCQCFPGWLGDRCNEGNVFH